MRLLVPTLALTLVACGTSSLSRPPPPDRFYYPTGIAFVRSDAGAGSNGVLYVVSGNWDKRYDFGSMTAVNLDVVSSTDDAGVVRLLPPFPASVSIADGGGPVQLQDLHVGPKAFVTLQSFTGELVPFQMPTGGLRLFAPARAEGDPLHIVEAEGETLTCFHDDAGTDRNCFHTALGLAVNDATPTGKGFPAAPQPFGLGIAANGDAFVTSLQVADNPPGTGQTIAAYMAHFDAVNPSIGDSNFIPLGDDIGTYDVVVGQRYAYVTGLPVTFLNPTEPDALLRLVDRDTNGVTYPQLRNQYHAVQARGIALSPDEQRVFILSRTPDALLVVHVTGAGSDTPGFSLERAVPLPPGANQLRVIPRQNQGNLIVISCVDANDLVFYDEDLGDLAAEVPGLGTSPYGLAVDTSPVPGSDGARIYVSDFGDGRIAVVDVPHLSRPQEARVVAHIGKPETCLVQANDPSCRGVTP